MKKFHIRIEQIIDDWFEGENENEALEEAEKAFSEMPIEVFIDDETEDE